MKLLQAFLPLTILSFCTACSTVPNTDTTAGVDVQVRQTVESSFSDAPIMIKVAACESGLRQYARDGSVLRGIQHPPDSGVFQINKSAHRAMAQKLGLDLDTTQGNVAYARHLYDTEGTAPWKSSRPCWSKYQTAGR